MSGGAPAVSGLEILRAREKELQEELARVQSQITSKTVVKKSKTNKQKTEVEIQEGNEARSHRVSRTLLLQDKTWAKQLLDFVKENERRTA